MLSTKLIEQCLKGNKKAQLELYSLYCDAMYCTAYRYVKDAYLAEDVTQESFINAFSNLNSFDGSSTFGAWLKQIVIHKSIDELRKRKFDLSIDDVPSLSSDSDDESWEVDGHIEVTTIKKLIDDLPHKYSVVLKLFLMEGYDHEEISQILDISINASRTQLHRGKTMLKNELKKQGYERFA